MDKGCFVTYLGDLYTESGQTLQCSFSSVSTPPIARVGAFFSILRDLQDFHSFAPLRIQKFSKNLLHFFRIFTNFLQSFGQNLFNFNEISPEFPQNFTEFTRMRAKDAAWGVSRIFPEFSPNFPRPPAVRPEGASVQHALI